MTVKYVDRQGREISFLTWAALIEQEDYRVLARDMIKGWTVETVWLGHCLPMAFAYPFETMVFPPDVPVAARMSLPFGGGLPCERRLTEPTARAAHDFLAGMLRWELGPRMITAGEK